MNERKIRNQKGAAVTGLVLALFFFIMLVGFFAFDSSRIQMAQRELTATCDSSSLAGTAMLTSYPTDNDDTALTKLLYAQGMAARYARNMFQAGNLLGQGLGNATPVSTYGQVTAVGTPGSTNFMISLADPQAGYAPVTPTAPAAKNGKAIMCYACYSYTPVFLSIVGVQQVGLNASSGGGLPQVDAVLVFDYSGSMDDATTVSFVRRVWDSTVTPPNIVSSTSAIVDCQMVVNAANPYPGLQTPVLLKGCNHYIYVTPPSTLRRLSDQLAHDYADNPNGSRVNVLPPSNLDVTDNSSSQANPHFKFDTDMRTNTLVARLPKATGTTLANQPASCGGGNWHTDYATPPGNCTLAPPYGYGYYYTPTLGTYAALNAPATGDVFLHASTTGSGASLIAAAMAYRPDAQTPTKAGTNASWAGTGTVDGIYMKNPIPSGYTATDYANVGLNRNYTDLVVNIANPGTWPYVQPVACPSLFTSFSMTFPAQEPDTDLAGATFHFEDLGVVVEASRGNLDSANNARGATLDRGGVWTINESSLIKQTSAVGMSHVAQFYQKAYQRLAMLCSQPIATALDGADGGFFQKINSLCDCRFGFVGFSDATLLSTGASPNNHTVGTAHGNTSGSYNSFYESINYYSLSASDYKFWFNGAPTAAAEDNDAITNGVGTGFRQPRRPLTKTETQANSVNGVIGCRASSSQAIGVTAGYSAAWSNTGGDANGLDNGRPIDKTDTYEAINTARQMFLDSANYNLSQLSTSRPAAKHAIVFFTDGVPDGGTSSSDASSALSVAASCKTDGIAIYSIGLDVTSNPILQTSQSVFLGNASTGMAGAAGNGGRFFPCTTAASCKLAFNAVARRLAQSQR